MSLMAVCTHVIIIIIMIPLKCPLTCIASCMRANNVEPIVILHLLSENKLSRVITRFIIESVDDVQNA